MSDDIAALREDLISELCQLAGGNWLVEAERVVDALDAYLSERLTVAAATLRPGGSVGGDAPPSAHVGGEVEATSQASPLWEAIVAWDHMDGEEDCSVATEAVNREIRALVERAHEDGRKSERARCIAVAEGCHDYGGGYHGDDQAMRAFQHGITTVGNALKAPPTSFQVRSLEVLGEQAKRGATT